MKTVLALSGGINSTVLLWSLARSGTHLLCIFVDHGQAAGAQEMAAAKHIVTLAQTLRQPGQAITLHIAKFQCLPPAPLGDNKPWFSRAGWPVVTAAARLAEAADARTVVLGCDCAGLIEDAAGHIGNLLHRFSNGGLASLTEGTSLFTPFVEKTKAEAIQRGHRLNVPLAETWSCWDGGPYHCGRCRGCQMRRWGFRDALLNDRTVYMSPPHLPGRERVVLGQDEVRVEEGAHAPA